MATFNFTTGPATLPDVGELSYNGCVFSPLFETKVSGLFVKDAAGRTTKEIEYTITADGYVTLPAGLQNVESTIAILESLLSKPAGALLYSGRGIKIRVNTAGGDQDVAWGPVPEILDIQPMGAGRSAKISWTVKTRIPPRVARGKQHNLPVLQFNYETTVSYDDAGFSSLNISGITEIPLTRASVADRAVTSTADDFRQRFPGELLATIDLTRFRITQREFKVSRDKRTLEFSVTAEELPWMAMPPRITVARGTFTFRPAKAGVGLANWLCTLTCTYTVPNGEPRRLAWLAFLALLRVRMRQGDIHGVVPPPAGPQNPGLVPPFLANFIPPVAAANIIDFLRRQFQQAPPPRPTRKVWLVDFNGSEGLYLDSKTVTFSATWRLVTVFSEILLASGLWKKVDGHDANLWAASVRDISGYSSWLQNRIDPTKDAIVDFGF